MKNMRELLFLIVGLFFLTSCSTNSVKRLWLKSPGWSRAQVVGGMGIPDPAPVVVDENGNIYFLFINGEVEALQTQIIALDEQAQLLWEHTFGDILKLPDDPQLVWDGERLLAFWISNGALFNAIMDRNGNVSQEPTVISGEVRVDSYSVAVNESGKSAVWFATDRRTSDLYSADVNGEDELILVDENGVLPSLRFDREGTLHAIWAHYPRENPQTNFLYASYDNGDYIPGNGDVVYKTSIPITADLVGPTLGLDKENVYIYWVRIFRTGLEAGSTQTRVVSFLKDAPEALTEPREISIPVEHDLTYEPFPEGILQTGPRYSLESPPSPRTTGLQDISPNLVHEEELVIAFRASVDYFWRRASSQIGVVYMEDGLPTSYQLLSFTQSPSTDPTIISNSKERLYITWLESGDVNRFDVYFASTAEGIQEAFNPLTVNDVIDLTAASTFGLLTGILLAPIGAVLWLVVPLFIVGLTSIFRRGDQTIRSPGTIITFVLAIAAFQISKIASLPDIVDYVPFSAWLPLPDLLKAPLQIIVPVAIMIVAIVVAWHFTYRRRGQSPLYFLILYVAIDALFTMAVYGVLFYGAF